MNCSRCNREVTPIGCKVTDLPFYWCAGCGSIKTCESAEWIHPVGTSHEQEAAKSQKEAETFEKFVARYNEWVDEANRILAEGAGSFQTSAFGRRKGSVARGEGPLESNGSFQGTGVLPGSGE